MFLLVGGVELESVLGFLCFVFVVFSVICFVWTAEVI